MMFEEFLYFSHSLFSTYNVRWSYPSMDGAFSLSCLSFSKEEHGSPFLYASKGGTARVQLWLYPAFRRLAGR